jgi:hypothetical protein
MKNKLPLLLFLISTNSFSQVIPFEKNTSVGMNVPVLIDNVLEFSLRHQFHKNMRLDFSLGGSPETRGRFKNGRYDNEVIQSFPVEQNTYYTTQSEKAAGVFTKLGFSFVFNVSDYLSSGNVGNFKFYAGPIIGLSKFTQEGFLIKTVYPKPNSDGSSSPNQQSVVTKSPINEKGTIFGSGFAFGITLADKKDISCDIGVDLIGFKRKSQFNGNSHTVGLGNNLVVRLNYNFPKKR